MYITDSFSTESLQACKKVDIYLPAMVGRSPCLCNSWNVYPRYTGELLLVYVYASIRVYTVCTLNACVQTYPCAITIRNKSVLWEKVSDKLHLLRILQKVSLL